MNRGCLFVILTFLVIPGSFVAVGYLSESKDCMNLRNEIKAKSGLIQAAKTAGNVEKANVLADDFRKWFITTRKTEHERLQCDKKGEIAFDIQRFSIWPIFILGFWSSWLLSARLVKRRNN